MEEPIQCSHLGQDCVFGGARSRGHPEHPTTNSKRVVPRGHTIRSTSNFDLTSSPHRGVRGPGELSLRPAAPSMRRSREVEVDCGPFRVPPDDPALPPYGEKYENPTE